jgi:hypothetical protein
MPTITTIFENKRACGYKKKGGFYLIGSTEFTSTCCKLPFPLTVCKCCGQGIKFSRGFTWISPEIFNVISCSSFPAGPGQYRFSEIDSKKCNLIDMYLHSYKLGLMWVGENNYKTPGHFINEARHVGISKRIAQIPREAVPGKTWIALAHKKAVYNPLLMTSMSNSENCLTPGVFMIFKLTAIQYIVTGKEETVELERLEKRGIQLVEVKPATQQTTIL